MAKRINPARKEAGIFMVMLAGVLLALITIIALFFASSFLSANKTRLQNATNFSSLAAIERFVRSAPQPGQPALTYNERANAARSQANALLDSQSLLGATHSGTGSVGELGYDGQNAAGGTIVFGVWYPNKSTAPPNPCGVEPCFSPANPQPGGTEPDPDPAVNAVKVNVKTPYPFAVPLLSLLGFDSLDIESESIAAVVPRCAVFLLETSLSSVQETHYSVPANQPATQTDVADVRPGAAAPPPTSPTFNCYGTDYYLWARPHNYTCPRNLMPFAFLQDQLLGQTGLIDPKDTFPAPCRDGDLIYQTPLGRIWCNLEYYDGFRRRFLLSYPYPPPDGMPQIPDYYRLMDSPMGKVAVDTLNRPKPLSDFLLGFNAGARMMIDQSSQADKAGLVAFQGTVNYTYPQTGLSTDLGFVAQATNADRINPGWVGPPSGSNPPNEPLHPNFVDLGFFGLLYGQAGVIVQGSNIVGAMDKAIALLSDTSTCPANAQKSIILASDGIPNCSYSASLPHWTCGPEYFRYLDSEEYLLNSGFDTGLAEDSILRRLQRAEISFSMFIAGSSGPNIINRFISNPAEPNGGHFVDFDEARALGMSSMPVLEDPAVNTNLFVDSRSEDLPTGPNSLYDECLNDTTISAVLDALPTEAEKKSACASYMIGRPGAFFRRPLAALYRMAVETGGWYCPLLPQAPAGSYTGTTPDSKLTHAYRQSLGVNARITVNPFNRNAGQEASVCAQQTLGLNPFVLVREGS